MSFRLLVLVLCQMVSKAHESNVVNLDDDTIEDAIYNNEHILINFYAPWCVHCKLFSTEYDSAADILKYSSSNTVIAKIDASVEKRAATDWNISGFPTLLYFNNGKMVEEYTKGRTASEISEYISSKLKKTTANIIILTSETIGSTIKNHEHILINFYAPECEHSKKLEPEYEIAAGLFKESGADGAFAKIDASVDLESLLAWKIRVFPTLVYFREGKRVENYVGLFKGAKIAQYMLRKSFTLNTEL